jgi:hypothetical protein
MAPHHAQSCLAGQVSEILTVIQGGREPREMSKLQSSLRDEEAHLLRHPALKYRAKVTPPLRGEEQPFFKGFLCYQESHCEARSK